MHVIKKIKPNDAECYQGNQTKWGIAFSSKSNQTIMLSWKSCQTIYNVIIQSKPNNAQCYQENYTKQSIMLSSKSIQTMHNLIRESKPNNA